MFKLSSYVIINCFYIEGKTGRKIQETAAGWRWSCWTWSLELLLLNDTMLSVNESRTFSSECTVKVLYRYCTALPLVIYCHVHTQSNMHITYMRLCAPSRYAGLPIHSNNYPMHLMAYSLYFLWSASIRMLLFPHTEIYEDYIYINFTYIYKGRAVA